MIYGIYLRQFAGPVGFRIAGTGRRLKGSSGNAWEPATPRSDGLEDSPNFEGEQSIRIVFEICVVISRGLRFSWCAFRPRLKVKSNELYRHDHHAFPAVHYDAKNTELFETILFIDGDLGPVFCRLFSHEASRNRSSISPGYAEIVFDSELH